MSPQRTWSGSAVAKMEAYYLDWAVRGIAACLGRSVLRGESAREGLGELRTSFTNVFGHEEVRSLANVSAYTSVDCGGNNRASAMYTLPANAYGTQSSCEWIESDKLKSQNCSTKIDGLTVSASGYIAGNDRNVLGNCSGGGHGKLKLVGTYKEKILGNN